MFPNHFEIPVLRFLLPLVLGIFSGSFYTGIYQYELLIVPLIIVLALVIIISLVKKSPLRIFTGITVFIVLFGIGFNTYQNCQYKNIKQHFSYNENFENFAAKIYAIECKDSTCNATLKIDAGMDSLSNLHITEGWCNAFIKFNPEDSIKYQLVENKNIVFHAKPRLLSPNQNPHAFNYQKFLNSKHIFHQVFLNTDDYFVVENKSSDFFSNAIFSFRKSSISTLQKYLYKDESVAICSAMILGYRDLIDDDLYKSFTDTGAIHVLAVSGLHVGILALLILTLLKGIPEKNTFVRIFKGLISLSVIWLFALITGAAPAVVRASSMFSIFLFGKMIYRDANIYNIIFFSAFLMLIFDPMFLFQVSFQFSFLALISIIYFYPVVKEFFVLPSKVGGYVGDLISVSVAAQFLVFPLTVFYFNKFPNYFWLSGIAAIPAATIILSLGFLLLTLEHLGLEMINDYVVAPLLNWSVSAFEFCIKSIQSLPYCVTQNISYDYINIGLLFTAMVFLMYFIAQSKARYLIVFLLLVLANTGYSSFQKHSKSIQEKLVIYDSRKSGILSLFIGETNYYYQSDTLNDKQKGFLSKRNEIIHDISDHIDIRSENNFYNEPIISVNNHTIVCDSISPYLQFNQSPDILWLSKHSLSNRYRISDINPKLIVVDGSISYYKKQKLIEEIEGLEIPFHDTSVDGAYEVGLR